MKRLEEKNKKYHYEIPYGYSYNNGLLLESNHFKVIGKIDREDKIMIISEKRKSLSHELIEKLAIFLENKHWIIKDLTLIVIISLIFLFIFIIKAAIIGILYFLYIILHPIINTSIIYYNQLLLWLNILIIPIGLILIIINMKFIKRDLSQFHSAEHMAISCIKNQEEITINNIRKQPNISLTCGSTTAIVITITYIIVNILSLKIFPFISNYILIIITTSVIFIELFKAIYLLYYKNNHFLKKLEELVLLLQKFLFLSKPEEKHIKLAYETLKELDRLEKNYEAKKQEA